MGVSNLAPVIIINYKELNMATNIKASFVSATGTVDSSSGRIRGYSFVNNSTAVKELILRDGGASGDTILKVQLNSGGSSDQYIEDAGIRYETNLHITVPTSAAGTIFTG
jgi:hypothetical protein|tara:strand:+ start:42 stop:371 length:330 start_codon:yes stop_codon:yes gene_type:complete